MTADGEDAEPRTGALSARIVLAAAGVLEDQGLDAMSVRAVASRAGVFPPTIFRLFGDKDGLLEAVGEYGFETYLRAKSGLPRSDDPVADLRAAWDLHVRFGLMQPAYYGLVFGQVRSGGLSRAGREAVSELERMVARVGALGRLRMSVERAAAIMHAGGVGVVTTLLGSSAPDLTVSEATRRAVFAAIIVPPAEGGPAGPSGAGFAGPAMALRTTLDTTGATALSPGELLLLRELLDRLADTPD
ncbi:TetR/AcrR family transcriptional regulator [Streptomyces sp. SID5789]|uniref:TetR/AcrR family transcriptional regulator n=1 Tax=Streptomyces sp. SID5789 TaxID=2690310 RepID=UPI00136DB363|nr:TetR/AcrR family transcriptional regulator [Streptomyces sp. SID5789]MZE68808.1 TetR family transcriptional regulator [Streptomyces sp. SID5789]